MSSSSSSNTNIINKNHKWSSSSSLSKLLTRISRTLSFSSKKCQQAAKKSNNAVKPAEPTIKTVSFVPKSAPVVRRNQPAQHPHSVQLQKKPMPIHYAPIDSRPHFIIEEDEDEEDFSRYSLRPNLSLFNISVENLHSETQELDDELSRSREWIDEIFHSTKIDEY